MRGTYFQPEPACIMFYSSSRQFWLGKLLRGTALSGSTQPLGSFVAWHFLQDLYAAAFLDGVLSSVLLDFELFWRCIGSVEA